MAESKPVKVVKELTSIAGEQLNTFSNDFQATLNEVSKKQENGKYRELVLML